MAEPKCSQLPWPLHKIGAIKMMKTSPRLARNKSNPVSRYLLRNCRAAIHANVCEARIDFNDEARMSRHEGMTKHECRMIPLRGAISDFVIRHLPFVISR